MYTKLSTSSYSTNSPSYSFYPTKCWWCALRSSSSLWKLYSQQRSRCVSYTGQCVLCMSCLQPCFGVLCVLTTCISWFLFPRSCSCLDSCLLNVCSQVPVHCFCKWPPRNGCDGRHKQCFVSLCVRLVVIIVVLNALPYLGALVWCVVTSERVVGTVAWAWDCQSCPVWTTMRRPLQHLLC